MLAVVQREIARLIVATRFRAGQEQYTTEERALEQVQATWPKHASLAYAIEASPGLLQVAFAAAIKLTEMTGDTGPAEAAGQMFASGVARGSTKWRSSRATSRNHGWRKCAVGQWMGWCVR